MRWRLFGFHPALTTTTIIGQAEIGVARFVRVEIRELGQLGRTHPKRSYLCFLSRLLNCGGSYAPEPLQPKRAVRHLTSAGMELLSVLVERSFEVIFGDLLDLLGADDATTHPPSHWSSRKLRDSLERRRTAVQSSGQPRRPTPFRISENPCRKISSGVSVDSTRIRRKVQIVFGFGRTLLATSSLTAAH